ncbi:MAG: tetratricopeptide repeat protein [Phycisphaerales bacterium]|nr:tetratricopeptide repeat protein [Phycisphaerales bacterium]
MNVSAPFIQTLEHPKTKVRLWMFAAMLVAGVLPYTNSFSSPFLFDDEEAIVENPHIRTLWPIAKALDAPPQSSVAGRPVVSLTLALNYHFGKLNPWGYHAVNLSIHLLAGLTLFGIIRRTLLSRRLKARYGPGAANLALAASILWMVHPLQTESVTYIIQRAESLMGLFYLTTVYLVIRGRDAKRRIAWYGAAVGACALGMATKEVMVTAPLLVLLYDRSFWSQSFRVALRRRRGLYVALGATWLILAGLMSSGPRSESVGFNPGLPTSWDYATTQIEVVTHYLRLAVIPFPLCLDYGWPIVKSIREIVPQLVALLILTGVTVWMIRVKSAWAFPGLWFFLILAPTSTVIPIIDAAFEHRMYLPLAAVSILVVVGVHDVVRRVARGRTDTGLRRLLLVLFLMTATPLGVLTYRRNTDYESAYSIWKDVVTKRPDNDRGHLNLGKALFQRGEFESSIEAYLESLRLNRDSTVHNNLGIALAQIGREEEAIAHCKAAIAMKPDWAEAHYNLGYVLARFGRYPEAIVQYQEALRQRPVYPEAHYNLGNAFAHTANLHAALQQYTKAIEDDPHHYQAHYNLAGALTSLGRRAEADVHFKKALDLAREAGIEIGVTNRERP